MRLLAVAAVMAAGSAHAQGYTFTTPILRQYDFQFDNGTGSFTSVSGALAAILPSPEPHLIDFTKQHYASDGSDYSPAMARTKAMVNANWAVGVWSGIYVPIGNWPLLTPIATPFAPKVASAMTGGGMFKSNLALGSSFTGTVFECSQTTQGTLSAGSFLPNDSATSAQATGCSISEMNITGNRNSSGQDAIYLSDGNDKFNLRNVWVGGVPGYCFTEGQALNTANGNMRESDIYNFRCENDGTTSKPSVFLTSTGTADAANQIQFTNLRVYASYGIGVLITNGNTNIAERKYFFLHAAVENSTFNNWQIGDSSTAGKAISQIGCLYCTAVSPAATYFNYQVTAPNGTAFGSTPSSIDFEGTISETGSGTGGGLDIESGHNITFRFMYNTTTGTQLTLGTSVNGPIQVSGQGDENTWTVTNNAPAGDLHLSNSQTWNAMVGSSLLLNQTTPASTSAACSAGQVAADATYIYTCVATNSWHRVANGTTW